MPFPLTTTNKPDPLLGFKRAAFIGLSELANPYKPRERPPTYADPSLYQNYLAQSRAIRTIGTALKKQPIGAAAVKTIGHIRAEAAHRKSVPLDVMQIVMGNVSQEKENYFRQLDFELAWSNYSESVNALQDNYSFLNQVNAEIHRIEEANRARKKSFWQKAVGFIGPVVGLFTGGKKK